MVSLGASEDFIQSKTNEEMKENIDAKFYTQLSFQEKGSKLGEIFSMLIFPEIMFCLFSQMPAFLLLPHHLPCHVLQPRSRGSSSLFHHPLLSSSVNPASWRSHFCAKE